MDDSKSDGLDEIINIAASSETAAWALLDMAWIADGVSDKERFFIRNLRWIAESSAAVAERVLALHWVADGVSDDERRFVNGLRSMMSSVVAAERVLALPWVADGISDSEARFTYGMEAATAERVLALPWVADGISDNEAEFTYWLGNISQRKVHVSERVLDLHWVADGISYNEARFAQGLILIASASAAVSERVLDLPWVADEISDTEADFINDGLRFITKLNVATAESVLALHWVADGVSDSEADFVLGLRYMTESSAAAVERVLALPWVADGVSDTEAGFTLALSFIAWADMDAALQVMDMPFLQTLEAADAAALDALARISFISFSDKDSDKDIADTLSRPMLKDGITDDEAPIVSMLGLGLDDKLLDPGSTTVERRTVELPLAGEVDLVIVRTRPGARRGMDLLENAVRESENLMGEPFPTRYAGLLYEDIFGDSGVVAINLENNIAIHPRYDVDDGSHAASVSPLNIAHEVAHYYWNGGAGWISEGMAELMESAIENRRVGTLIDFTRAPCEFAQSIKEMEALPSEQRWLCSYTLGERLFVSLLRTLGEDAFWDGARSLYAASHVPRGARGLYDNIHDRLYDAGIEDVRQAFGADASDVIKRWYEGE